ncbi:TRAP transporter small permease [Roseinatronobacter alkalisoli]|uniref:TRAP transporter small permease protein n=1 Tax=Roseinatronobacter alkalisoli TaxID=3028235 RepID=A0ABT5TBE9_9RHOB|nr:TRAP transporter small permease [Roseinatronobacter sp. HJB301]MDD7972432.1 TRAP transporter small permease [Roseinatronobacter sp. HJB301]
MIFLVKLAVGLCRGLSLIGAVAVVLMMLHVSLDVVLLNLFRLSMNTTPEIVARYYMVAVAFLPLGWLTLRNQMIAVELLDFAMSRPVRLVSDFVIYVIAAGVYAVMTYANWLKALREAKSGAYVELVSVQMPVWHSYFLVPAGFALATLACVLMALAILSVSIGQTLKTTTESDET